ncbi:MAG: LamG-like jellyroll fold domain-containing protein [Bacteroidota bacterium]
MLKRYTVYITFLLFYLFGTPLFAQQYKTAYGIGFIGGQKTVIQNGKKVTYGVSSGQIAAPHHELVKDEVSLMGGFRHDVKYFPVVFDKDLFVSKGYFSDYVQLQWNVIALGSRIKKFKIYRKPLGAEGDSLLVAVVGADTYTWRDPYADKGTLYKYTLFAEGIADRLRAPYINSIESVGFSTASGTVSGRITFDGGTAVEGVNVLAETKGNLSGKSVHLNGEDAYLVIPHGANDTELALEKGFTFQAWCRFEGESKGVIFSKGDQYDLAYEPGTGANKGSLTFRIKDATVTLPFQHPVDSFFHVTGTYLPNKQLKLYAYVTDRVDSAVVQAGTTPSENTDNINIGRSAEGNYIKGYINEMRLWSRALTYTDIKRDYNRFIAGTEKGLVGYWRLNSGIGDRFYDFARKGFTFYENHGYLRRAIWSEIVPLGTQLAYKGVTDEKGNYTISGFPYETEGSQYSFIPVFGVHTFDPNQQSRFIGDGASIQNGIDFKDVSSFKVSGNIRYRNTKFPVEGVSILIDGKPAVNKEGQLILSDNLGRFLVDVPIGLHSVRLSKTQHGFAKSGRFPAPTAKDSLPLFNFQQPIAGLEFIDTTLVKVAGRVVGGPVEQAKLMGFGKSKNNIGDATIYLTSEKGYDLTLKDSTQTYTEKHILSRATFSTKYVTISVDTTTGEYVAMLPPEKYKFTNVTAGSYVFGENYLTSMDVQKTLWNTEQLSDTVKVKVKGVDLPGYPPYNAAQYDSVFTVTRQDTTWIIAKSAFAFQTKKDFILRNNPNLTVTNAKGEELFGEESFTYKDDKQNKTEEIPLIDQGEYTFGHPVFIQRSAYQMYLNLFEQYENDRSGKVDKVPVIDGRFEIINNLAINTNKETLLLNQKGKAVYSFKGGLPEINKDALNDDNSFTKTVSITAFSGSEGAIRTIWRENNPFRGFVFGAMPVGNNFVTTGPTEVTTILRDPPGSNSNAYLEKGTVKSESQSYSNSHSFSQEGTLALHLGAEVKTFAGVGVGVINEIEYGLDIELGLSSEQNWVTDGERVITTEVTKTWATSGETDYVGADGDVFVGNASNIVYGKALDLTPLPSVNCTDCGEKEYKGYKLGMKESLRMNPQFSTFFIFSQSYIENTLIPNLESIRNSFLTSDSTAIPTADRPVYISLVKRDDAKFGSDNTDKKVWSTLAYQGNDRGKGPSYSIQLPAAWVTSKKEVVDSVWYFNRQIKEWKYWLGENEKRKVQAKLIENISFDAGTTFEKSVTVDTTSSSSRTFEWAISPSLGFSTSQDFNGFGLSESLTLAYGHGESDTEGSENGKSSTYGYALADGDAGDYMSIDVKDAKDGFGPVFYLRAGATSCPYEPGTETKYYSPGTPLADATLKRESCEINVAEAVRTNIPENRAGEFMLILKNNSETKEDVWYDLKVDDTTNPFGAVLEIDGQPIANGRSFFIPAGTALQKTMKIRKGSSAVLDYADLALYLTSQCDESVIDTVSVSAFFQPGCSDIEISLPKDKWVVNTNTQPGSVLNVEIKKYDLNYGKFKQIAFQYKPASSSQWTTQIIYYNPKTVTPAEYEKADEPKAWISGATLQYAWNMGSLPDREYDIRAKTICVLGPGNEVETPTEIIHGIKDVKRPRIFGSPQPADGVLSAGEDIMIQFDEPIEAGLLTPFNFNIQAVLNNYPVSHNTSIALDGVNDYVKIPDGLHMTGSFTVEFWLQRNVLNQESVVFSKGNTATDALEIGFTADNKLAVDIAGQKITTSVTFTDSEWHHYAVVYSGPAKKISAYKDDKYILEQVPVVAQYSGTGPIALGKSVVSNDRFLNGNMHELRIWSKSMQLGQVYAQMSKSLSGSEVGLTGYWPMDEAFGTKALDKARFRHALLFADWQVLPKGKALAFDGIDDYLEINTASTVVISNEMDYSLELWFKGEPGQKDVVLFSSGKGDGSDKYNAPDNSLSIGFNGSGQLFMFSNGQEIVYNEDKTDHLDNNWHHLAITLQRKGNINLFVDGELKTSKSSESFGGLAGAKMWLGARGYKENTLDVAHDSYFRGAIDELRIWKLARKQQQLLLDRNAKLKGTEMGLIAYYPLEYYATNSGIKLMEPTLQDQWSNVYGPNGGTGLTFGGADFSNESPNLKDARPVQKIDFDWAVNEDKIIITPASHMASVIEKSVLEITLSDIEDKFENRLASPASWTAFVDKNQLKWGEDKLVIKNKLYQPYTFTVDVINKGGKEQKFSIKNLPPWLTAQPSSGILAPLTNSQIVFKVNEALNTGYFNEDIFLSGDFGFDEKLNIDLSVLADSPNWKVNVADYQYSMNIIGQLKVNQIISTDSNDKVAAFVNGECRGVANLKYIEQLDMYQLYLDVYSNKVSDEKIELRVWDASAGTEHRNVKPDYVFGANDLHGSPSQPEMIEAGTTFVQNMGLEKGWNWVSFNVTASELPQVNATMNGLVSKNGDQIKGQSVVDVFATGIGWTGSLSNSGGFEVGKMYMMRTSNAGKLELVGNQINPTFGINVQKGWNWLGVVPRFNILVNEALANLTATNGDVIKGKRAFATYQEGLGWVGSLQSLIPGEGYLLKSATTATLVYPETSSLQGGRITGAEEAEVKAWPVSIHAYPNNMTVIAQLDHSLSDDFVVGAFVGSQCRGYASPVALEKGHTVYFLTIQGEVTEDLSLKAYRLSDGSTHDLVQQVQFGTNASAGTVPQPLLLSFRKEVLATQQVTEVAEVHPNPFSRSVTLTIAHAQAAYKIQITDLSGRPINQLMVEKGEETATIDWNGTNSQGVEVSAGVYLMHISSDHYSQVIKVIKK